MSKYLGVFGFFSWQESIALNVGLPINRGNALHYGGIVDKVVKLNNTGKYTTPDALAQVTGLSVDMVRKILREYLNYKATGKVITLKEMPSGVGNLVSNVGKGAGDIVKPIAGTVLWPVAIIASIAGIIYLSTKGKR